MSIINSGLDMSNPTGLGSGPTTEMDFGEIFEIHITGDERIHELGYKTITIDNLRPDGSLIKTEHMTSIVKKFDYWEAAYHWAMNLGTILQNKTEIKRVKVECPPYPHYLFLAKYAEVHFKDDSFKFPTSRNSKGQLLAVERVSIDSLDYLKNKYPTEDVEICLYDSNQFEDLDWLILYGEK